MKMSNTDRNNQQAAAFDVIRKMAAVVAVPADLRRVAEYSAYLQGALAAFQAFADEFPQIFKGKDAAYHKAVFELATSSKRAADLYLSRAYQVRFRNHKVDKKGKLLSCEAYFAQPVTTIREVT